MSEPKRLNDIMKPKMERKETTNELDGKFLGKVQGAFFSFVKSKRVICKNEIKDSHDIEPREAYEKMAVFLAEMIAFFCPKTYAVYDYKPYAGPKRGVIISGEIGRGKTILMRNSYHFLENLFQMYRKERHEEPGAGLVWNEATRFSISSAKEGPSYVEAFLYGHQKDILFFDDLGNERTAKIYGNQINGEEIIRVRNESQERFHVPTIFTTNLTRKDIETRYGGFNSSRVKGDYDTIFLDFPVDRRNQQLEIRKTDTHSGGDGSEHIESEHDQEDPEEETGTRTPDGITNQIIQDARAGKPIPDFYRRNTDFKKKLIKKVGEKEAEEWLKASDHT